MTKGPGQPRPCPQLLRPIKDLTIILSHFTKRPMIEMQLRLSCKSSSSGALQALVSITGKAAMRLGGPPMIGMSPPSRS